MRAREPAEPRRPRRLGQLASHVCCAGSAATTPVLSEAQHQQFVTDGLCVLRGAVPPEVCAAAVRELEASPATERTDGGADEKLAATLTPQILAAVAELFGGSNAFEYDPRDPANLARIARRSGDFTRGGDFARPRQEGRGGPQTHVAHIDDNVPTAMPSGWAVGTFIFLTDVPVEDAGAFVCFPGSPARLRVATADAHRCLVEVAPLVSGAPREMLVRAGDVVLCHHIMGHCGSSNLVNPTTRHAFFPRWKPIGRVVPGFKPFEQMSTVEKANSARYIRSHLHPELPLSPLASTNGEGDPRVDAILRQGVRLPDAGAAGTLSCYGLLHHAAAAQVAWVSTAEPSVVRFACSADGVCGWAARRDAYMDLSVATSWLRALDQADRPALYIRDTDPHRYERSTAAAAQPLRGEACESVLLPAVAAVTHIGLHQYGDEALLAITCHIRRDDVGHSATPTPDTWEERSHFTALFASRDCADWRIVVPDLTTDDTTLTLPFDFYASTLSPSVERHSHAVFTVSPTDPGSVYCSWARDWYASHPDAAAGADSDVAEVWTAPSFALRAPPPQVPAANASSSSSSSSSAAAAAAAAAVAVVIADLVVDEGEADGCGRWGAIVADVATATATHELHHHHHAYSWPHFCRPHDVAVNDDESSLLQPLGFDVGSSGPPLEHPRRVRVFHRAQSYWLCSFVADCKGEDAGEQQDTAGEARLHWGIVEWCDEAGVAVAVPELRALRTARELAHAHAVVGLM
jgi:hypothetical protein